MRFVGIDPATETGVVALDEDGDPELETSIIGKGEKKPGGITLEQRISLENQLFRLLMPDDEVLKEGIANGSQMLITTAQIHGGLEGMIARKNLTFDKVQPLAVKKYVGVTGYKIIDGKKVRLEGEKEKKAAMAAGALKHFEYSHPNNNVVDAYIIAKICEAVYRVRRGKQLSDYPKYQQEVIDSIINPPPPKKKKKKTEKTNKRPGKPVARESHTQNTEQACLF
ncbi:hypothetical protein EJP82_01015 [Paenibacillus anaericanus]|uniref:Uncharacterized protein n=1 Tax=Paenibacillus anaericanus TaxID=170367 RepID=A0A433YF93_9BACL|nr:hypothetical protein [Paenibacillus anaericanus]RUT48554.1 hypothetical protein EJP82_01015 [Paenibacillus anaericanus]